MKWSSREKKWKRRRKRLDWEEKPVKGSLRAPRPVPSPLASLQGHVCKTHCTVPTAPDHSAEDIINAGPEQLAAWLLEHEQFQQASNERLESLERLLEEVQRGDVSLEEHERPITTAAQSWCDPLRGAGLDAVQNLLYHKVKVSPNVHSLWAAYALAHCIHDWHHVCPCVIDEFATAALNHTFCDSGNVADGCFESFGIPTRWKAAIKKVFGCTTERHGRANDPVFDSWTGDESERATWGAGDWDTMVASDDPLNVLWVPDNKANSVADIKSRRHRGLPTRVVIPCFHHTPMSDVLRREGKLG